MSTRNFIEGYVEIPMVGLLHRYHINRDGDIIFITNIETHSYQLIYHGRMKTAEKPIAIHDFQEDIDIEIAPVVLYMTTFYGYAPFTITRKGKSDLFEDFIYEIHEKKEVSPTVMMLDGIEFRRSEFFDKGNVYISKNGVLYNDKTKKVPHHTWKFPEYNYYTYNKIALHRIVYDAWVGPVGGKEYEVHHKDDNEWNNFADNLEKLTRAEHLMQHNMRLTTKEQVIEIAELLMAGLSTNEIVEKVGVAPETVNSIRSKNRFKSLTEKYEFPEVINRGNNTQVNDDIAHEICKLLQEEKLTNQQIAEKYRMSQYTIADIRRGVAWKRIADTYTFKRRPDLFTDVQKPTRLEDVKVGPRATISINQVKEIWSYLQEGKSITDISKITGLNYKLIAKIKRRVRWTNVTDLLGPLPDDLANDKIA